MAVTPSELFADARKKVATASTEAEYRNATHCVYYAVFYYIAHHSAYAGFRLDGDGGDHRRLIAFLKDQTNTTLRTIGYRHLPRLRALRNRADYSIEKTFSRSFAQEALERAEEIIALLPALATAPENAAPVE